MPTARTVIFLCIVLALAATANAATDAFISVDASPSVIAADGKSSSQILVTVLTRTGEPVPDDTEVRLTTSAGDITPAVYTTAGHAVGILTAASIPQIATVTAISGSASASVQVQFATGDEEESGPGSSAVRISGGSLAYSVDTDTVIASSGTTITYKGVTIEAVGAQLRQASGQIRAQGRVNVEKSGKALTADALAWDFRGDRIRLLDSADPKNAKTFDASRLKPIDDQKSQSAAQEFAPLMDDNGKSWIIAERVVVIPGEKVMFYRASIYVGDAKVIRMPYYCYSYSKRESILQQVRYTSSDGILVDLPFYYQMTDSRVGSVKLRYAANGGESGGYSAPRRGLSLGLEQEYSLNDQNRGRLFVDAVGSSRQAFELAHHLDFGSVLNGGRADVSWRYQPTSSYAKGLYSGSVNIAGSMHSYNYSIFGYFGGSRIEQIDPLDPENINYFDQSSCSMKAVFKPKSPIRSTQLGRITPNYALGYGSLATSSGAPTSSCLYQSVGFTSSRDAGNKGRTDLTFDTNAALTMTSYGATGAGLHAGPTVRTRWNFGSASLRYTLNMEGGTTDAASSLARHQVGVNFFLTPGSKLNTSSSINYGLDTGRLNLYSMLNYRLTPRWQIRSTYSLYRYAYQLNGISYSYGTSYLKIGAYHPLGLYEIGLAWSPDGQDYGIDRSRHLWLELNGGRF